MHKKEKLVRFLTHQATVPLTEEEIGMMLCVPKQDRAFLSRLLRELVDSGHVQYRHKRYSAKQTVSKEEMLSGIFESHGFMPTFPPAVMNEADKVPSKVESIGKRQDFRDLLTFTIDGADAKDFDDAISILKTDAGFRLYVHIADVSHYVHLGSEMDQEAYKRGTSCYFPDKSIPMLPHALSNGICSLNPHVDRLTITTTMDISESGDVLSASIAEGVIRSDFRLIYDKVSLWLKKGKADKKHENVFPALQLLDALSSALSKRRQDAGSIDFNLPEPEILFDADGYPADIRKRKDGRANRMIENAMVLTNRVVTEFAQKHGAPFIYRVHKAPDKEKLEALSGALSVLGLSIPGKFTGKKAAELLQSEQGKDREYIVSTLLLRSMMKAQYSHENTGHFGLALEDYCHFTSPIRRYPDLTCHRIIKAILRGQPLDKFVKKVPRTALFSTEREEAATEAERAAVRYLMCLYMEKHIGEVFPATISSVTEFGFFVMLPNLAEGLVHVKDLGDDYYIFDGNSLTLTGKHSGTAYCLGQSVSVRLVRVDSTLSRIDFEITEDPDNGKNNCTKQKSKT